MVNKKALGISAVVLGSIGWSGYMYVDNFQGEKVAYEFKYQGVDAWVNQRFFRVGNDDYTLYFGDQNQFIGSKGQGWLREGCVTSDDRKLVCVNLNDNQGYFVLDKK